MDSLTQIVLGAAVGEICLGKKLGNKAQLMGAIAGTIPDLDVVLTPFLENDLAYLKVHRSYSHAIFTHVLLAFPLAYWCYKIFKQKVTFTALYILWFLGLATHAMLDCCTTYGTQFFLPFSNYLVGLNNINIIDPLYTLPFMACLIICLCIKKEKPLRRKVANFALIISCGYMALTFVSKNIAHTNFTNSLKLNNITYKHLSSTPTILNNILWAGIAYTDSTIHVAEYSHLQKNKNITWATFNRNLHLLNQVSDKNIVNTLNWFAQDKSLIVQQHPDTLQYYIVKWGRFNFDKTTAQEAFGFYYKVFKSSNNTWQMMEVKPDTKTFSFKKAFKDLWYRIFN